VKGEKRYCENERARSQNKGEDGDWLPGYMLRTQSIVRRMALRDRVWTQLPAY
jgi:hypothetical protein